MRQKSLKKLVTNCSLKKKKLFVCLSLNNWYGYYSFLITYVGVRFKWAHFNKHHFLHKGMYWRFSSFVVWPQHTETQLHTFILEQVLKASKSFWAHLGGSLYLQLMILLILVFKYWNQNHWWQDGDFQNKDTELELLYSAVLCIHFKFLFMFKTFNP